MVNLIQQFFHALTADCRDCKYLNALWFKFSADALNRILSALFHIDRICFVCCDHLRSGQKLWIVSTQLLIDRTNICDRIASLCGSCVHYMDQNLGSLDVTQEIVSQTDALGSSFDQTWDICHDKGLSIF